MFHLVDMGNCHKDQIRLHSSSECNQEHMYRCSYSSPQFLYSGLHFGKEKNCIKVLSSYHSVCQSSEAHIHSCNYQWGLYMYCSDDIETVHNHQC